MIAEFYEIVEAGMYACLGNEHLSRSCRRICMLRPKGQTSQSVK